MAGGNIFQRFGTWFMTPSGGAIQIAQTNTQAVSKTQKGPNAFYGAGYNHLFAYSYNGEKNLGELGPIKDYRLDYEALRLRSWQALMESEVAQMVLHKFTLWIIGPGLKLQAQPSKDVLKSEKIELSTEAFNQQVETRWDVWADADMSSHDGMQNLHMIAQECHKNAIVGGDVLVILRFDEEIGEPTVQLIDGVHVASPVVGSEWWPQELPNGNQLINGIEMDKKGKHIAFWVRKKLPEFGYERIEARNNGLVVAFMVYGLKYRLDNKRGMSLIACVLETLKKMERYKEATLGSAEERQKIVYQIIHGVQSTGESPLLKNLAKAHDADANGDELPVDIQGRELASTVAVTTNKATYNMAPDSKLEALESKNELHFEPFYTVNIDVVCAAINMPPNVAMSKYNDSFSASRAATKDWENTIKINRSNFQHQFYKHVYKFWLTIQIMKMKVNAPGYLRAFFANDLMTVEACIMSRFTGPMFPHIDPLKEVLAERKKLGSGSDHIPLTTIQQATEALEGGDSDNNMRQYAEELNEAEELGIKPVLKNGTEDSTNDDDSEDGKKKQIKKGN